MWGSGQNMDKTKIVQKKLYIWDVEPKCLETGQDSTGSLISGNFFPFLDCFSLCNAKRIITKAFLDVTLVSLILKEGTIS